MNIDLSFVVWSAFCFLMLVKDRQYVQAFSQVLYSVPKPSLLQELPELLPWPAAEAVTDLVFLKPERH